MHFFVYKGKIFGFTNSHLSVERIDIYSKSIVFFDIENGTTYNKL
jgi:hypothetical protein